MAAKRPEDEAERVAIQALRNYPVPVRARASPDEPMKSYNPVAFAVAAYAAHLQSSASRALDRAFRTAATTAVRRAFETGRRLVSEIADRKDTTASCAEAFALLEDLAGFAAYTHGKCKGVHKSVCVAVRTLEAQLPAPETDWIATPRAAFGDTPAF